MEISKIKYKGDLRTEAVHLSSGDCIITDAPKDNMGKGAAFSPTDLMATSLGCCAVTIMGITANKQGIKIGEIDMTIEKHMASDPRRVKKVVVKMRISDSGNLTDSQKKVLENAALTCPVSKSLHPDLEQDFRFEYL